MGKANLRFSKYLKGSIDNFEEFQGVELDDVKQLVQGFA